MAAVSATLVGYAALAQALIEGAQGWIAAHRRERGHVEDGAHRGAAAKDRFMTLPASALLTERRHSDQGCDFAAVETAQLRQTREQHSGQPRTHARHAGELLLERLQARRGLNPLSDLMVDGAQLAFERANRALDTFAQPFGRLRQPVVLGGQHPQQLRAAVDQQLEFIALGVEPRRCEFGATMCGKGRQHLRVETVGLGELTMHAGEVAHVGRIDPGALEIGRHHLHQQCLRIAAGSLQHDQRGMESSRCSINRALPTASLGALKLSPPEVATSNASLATSIPT